MSIMRYVTENGLTVFLAPMRGAKTITGLFVVRAGWKYEREDEIEVAHFHEHMGFKGTQRRPTAFHISSEIERVGGSANAFTGEETIAYFIKAPARHHEMVLDVLADIVLNPILDPEEIEREKGPVKEEWNMYRASPFAKLKMIIVPKLLFGGHSLAHIPTDNDIDRVNRETLLAYMEDLFVGPNSAVVCAGRIPKPAVFLAELARHFAALPSYSPRRQAPVFRDRQRAPRIQLVNQDMDQILVTLAVKCPPIHYPRREALNVLSVILGGGMSSRLFLEIRERRGLAYGIQSDLDLQRDIGILSVSAGLNVKKWKEGVRLIMEELNRLRTVEVADEELSRAKEIIIAREEMSSETSDAVAGKIARNWALLGEPEDAATDPARIKAVRAEDIQRVAAEIFRNDRLNLAVLGPVASNERALRSIVKFA